MEVATETGSAGGQSLWRFSKFHRWLEGFGETSLDHQSFFAGPVGGFAKSLYYRQPRLGIAAVAPMIFFEAFVPSARRLFHHPVRFPIADAHYAMGFAFLYEATSDSAYLERAIHFLRKLEETRCPDFQGILLGLPVRLGNPKRHDETGKPP